MLIKNTLKNNTSSDITNKEIENFLKIFSAINQIENKGKSINQGFITNNWRRNLQVSTATYWFA